MFEVLRNYKKVFRDYEKRRLEYFIVAMQGLRHFAPETTLGKFFSTISWRYLIFWSSTVLVIVALLAVFTIKERKERITRRSRRTEPTPKK